MKYEKTRKVPILRTNISTPNQSRKKIWLRKFNPIQLGEPRLGNFIGSEKKKKLDEVNGLVPHQND